MLAQVRQFSVEFVLVSLISSSGYLSDFKKASEELRQRLGIVNVLDRVHQVRLRWFRHVQQKDESNWHVEI